MLTKDEILAIITNELSQSDNTSSSGNQESLSYYLGLPNGTEVEGRSQVISTDVADAIEWIMPQIMESFTQNNEIVIFDPVHDGDERQAELESEYVYEVLMKQNDGFIVLHQFVKDALMQKNGILKVYYAKHNTYKISSYTGINEQQLQVLLSEESIELLEKSEYVDQHQTDMKRQQMQQQFQQIQAQQNPQAMQQIQALMAEAKKPVMLYDVKVSAKRTRGQIYVDPVPPEDFRVSTLHNSINLDKARFTAHIISKTVSEIMTEYGISWEVADEYPEGSTAYEREYRFSMQGEDSALSDESEDPSQAIKEVAECFMMIDIDETGIAKPMKITVVGGDTPTDIISVEDIDGYPWVSTTTFLMSHKFYGLSITDRLMQIQDQKTALWRNMLDNMYLQNNQRNVVIENQVNMDDLLVSRPGGIIRAKRLDAITPLVTPQLGQDAYMMMEYLDKVRSGRTGVDPDGGASPSNVGDRVGSQGVDRLMNAKEDLVGLIIRVMAETGIKPLCIKIRDLTIKHIDSVHDFRFRGVWHKVKPSGWCERTKTTVRVGTGTGNVTAKIAAITTVMTIQEKILANPNQTILSERQVFTAIDDFCKFSGLNGASRYFLDPESPEGQQNAQRVSESSKANQQKQDSIQQAMVKAEVDISQAEVAKANAQMESVKYKAMAEQAKIQLDEINSKHKAELEAIKHELEQAKAIAERYGKDADLQFKYDQMNTTAAIELTRIEAEKAMQQDANYQQNKSTVE
ncbi:cell envelope integrity protein TolA [Polynucleobacter sp.]|uniref:cell envelope integrity protein TolA n=1 Tax=Polynucleobacter sp. TaxID=2029855 RepID=UPI003F6958EC